MPSQAPAVRADAPAAGHPSAVPAFPFLRAGRPLKAWRYVGLYAEDLMLCAGRVRVAGVPQSFWAVWDREAGVLHERTTSMPGQVALPDGRVRVRAPSRGVDVDLQVEAAGDAVDVRSPHGAAWIWTRKTPITASGTVRVAGRTRHVRGSGLIDDSAGHHARDTAWEWSAGNGTLTDGRRVTWNLVTGVHDGAAVSERTVWVDGRAHPVGPVRFTGALDGIAFAEGGALAFSAEAVRERHDAVGPVRSDYVQPFGTFTGTLPGSGDALTLAAGFGVMERHRARW